MSNFEKFKEQLSSKEWFYGEKIERTGAKIRVKEHERVLNVWKKFEIKTMKDYHSVYLKCDVLLLVHVFEKFRDNILKNYGLCTRHYLGAPAQP